MKNITLIRFIQKTSLSCFLIALTISFGYGQVKQVLYYNQHDVTIGSGTILNTHEKNLDGGQLQLCNYDNHEASESYFESWIKFDFTTLEDSIPDGHQILYAELKFRVSANAGPQGARFFHLYDIDDWLQEELTWDNAQELNYEEEGSYDQFDEILPEDAGGTSARPTVNVTDQVLFEMGDEGNKLLTIRCEPYVKEYTEGDPVYGKRWLGFYSREVTWDLPPDAEFNPYCPQITLWIGPEEPKVFSDIVSYGDISNYTTVPSGYGYWLVRDDEGDARLRLAERPAPIEGTLGGFAIYEDSTYTDFDITLNARLDKEKSGGLDPKADFAVVFGHVNNKDYRYMLFTGEDINGFYVVDTTGGLDKAEVGELNTTPAVADMNYHEYRLVRNGTTVTAYIDGEEYMSVTDDALGVEGKIGMGSYNDVAWFDDFVNGEPVSGPQAVYDQHQARFTIYPNPAAGQIHISAGDKIESIAISSILGQEILTIDNIRSRSLEIDISDYEAGIYFIIVKGENNIRATGKFIKE
ncbi:MAG: T9SS type A sorting domain-containing protein [Bacteroidales bacterium]